MKVSIHFEKSAMEEYKRIKVEDKKLFDAIQRRLSELKSRLER